MSAAELGFVVGVVLGVVLGLSIAEYLLHSWAVGCKENGMMGVAWRRLDGGVEIRRFPWEFK